MGMIICTILLIGAIYVVAGALLGTSNIFILALLGIWGYVCITSNTGSIQLLGIAILAGLAFNIIVKLGTPGERFGWKD